MAEENDTQKPDSEAVDPASAGSGVIWHCLENGQMQWKMWAEHWRTSPAYGCNQPEIHPTHAKVIAEFDAAREELREIIQQAQWALAQAHAYRDTVGSEDTEYAQDLAECHRVLSPLNSD